MKPVPTFDSTIPRWGVPTNLWIEATVSILDANSGRTKRRPAPILKPGTRRRRASHWRYTLWVNRWWFQKIRYIAGVEGRSVNKEIEQCMKRRVREFEAEYGPIEMEWKELRPLHTEGPI